MEPFISECQDWKFMMLLLSLDMVPFCSKICFMVTWRMNFVAPLNGRPRAFPLEIFNDLEENGHQMDLSKDDP